MFIYIHTTIQTYIILKNCSVIFEMILKWAKDFVIETNLNVFKKVLFIKRDTKTKTKLKKSN